MADHDSATSTRPSRRRAHIFAWIVTLAWTVFAVRFRPSPAVALGAIPLIGAALWWGSRTRREPIAVMIALGILAIVRPHRDDEGFGRLYVDQTYHHQALRALNHAAAQGADVSEVLEATTHVRSGDAQGWYATWTTLGDRNLARARATKDRQSRGQALLRAHTYYLRAEFFLPPDDPKRPDSFVRNTRAFYEGLDTLGIEYEKFPIPYGSHHLNAVYYPGIAPVRRPLIVFCGGFDSTMEELYFFLVAAARARGYSVLTYEGPGQGSVLREQGLPFTHAWEKPTSAVLDEFLGKHPRPDRIVLIGLSLGGYLAPRAAAFDDRFDGVVSYDAFFDVGAVARRDAAIPYALRSAGLESMVGALAALRSALDPGFAWSLSNGRWTLAKSKPLDVVDALAPFTLESVAARIRQDVLLFAGVDDQFIPLDQLEEYKRALVNARSVTAKVYDRASGGAEHSQLGASTLWQANFFDWMDEKFGR
jgi:alpha-beta hydrolase superfamily lysophospholipase